MKLLFTGTPAVALPSLRALLDQDRHEVVAVLTRPQAPSGRGRKVQPSPVADFARAHGIEVFSPASPSDPVFLAEMHARRIECCPVVAYGALLREPALSLPSRGWVNLHFSLLPAWRGAAPVQHAILHGDATTGASTFLIGPGLDDGPVYGVMTESVRPSDTAGDLLERLSIGGAQLLLATLDGIAEGSLTAVAQPVDGISLAPKLTPADARISFDQPALAIDRRIRACTPTPGAWTNYLGDRMKLGPVGVVTDSDELLAPGELAVNKHQVLVGTATVPIVLGLVQPPGRRMMPAADWMRGRSLRADWGAGERLG